MLFQARKEYSPQEMAIPALQGIFFSGNGYSILRRNILFRERIFQAGKEFLTELIFQSYKEYYHQGVDFPGLEGAALPIRFPGSKRILPDIHKDTWNIWRESNLHKIPANDGKIWEENILPSNSGCFMGCKHIRNSMFLGNILPSGKKFLF